MSKKMKHFIDLLVKSAVFIVILIAVSGVWLKEEVDKTKVEVSKKAGTDKMAHKNNNKALETNADGIKAKMRDDIFEEFKRLVNNQVEPWVFFNSGKGGIKKFDGKSIPFSGVFSGSKEECFWKGYIEPFIEDVIKRKIEETVELAKGKKVSLTMVLYSTEVNLSGGIDTVYRKMQKIDRRLRGGGYPESVPMRDVSLEIKTMNDFLDKQIKITENLNTIIPEVEKKEPIYKILWKILLAIGVISGVVWTGIQIYESETIKKLFRSSETKMQSPLHEMKNTNIFAEVSKDGEILRANEFPWKIEKSKKEGNILYSIIGRDGDATAVTVIPDTPKYTVYKSHKGMVIKYTCPEEKISDFKIVIKY